MKLNNDERDYIARVYEKYTLCGKLIAYEKANIIALIVENNASMIINDTFELEICNYLHSKCNFYNFILSDEMNWIYSQYLSNDIINKIAKVIATNRREK